MDQVVQTGIDRVAVGAVDLPRTARYGVLTNRAARAADGRWSGTTLLDAGYHVTLWLGPEHGLAVDAAAGAPVGHTLLDDIPVLSLYGADRSPVDAALESVDALIVDLPDIGCRYYTYNWTVRELLKLAQRHETPVYCLDRPNPLGGVEIEGSIPDGRHDSAVCASSVPVRHGLTLGELALWNRREFDLQVDLQVITASGWRPSMTWADTGLSWTPPSPAIVSAETAWVYPGTCLLEGTNVSEGRGTDAPFMLVGAPFVSAEALAAVLQENDQSAGVAIEPVSFTPTSSKWVGQVCHGVRFRRDDRRGEFRPVRAGLALVAALAEYPEFRFIPGQFDALAGTALWRERLEQGATAADIADRWEPDEARFRAQRASLLLY